MKEVFLVDSDKKEKAEELLKKDDEINRGSIIIKSASSLEIDEDGYFIILDASEHAIKKAISMLSDIAKVYIGKDKVIASYEEQENTAIEGFGNMLKD